MTKNNFFFLIEIIPLQMVIGLDIHRVTFHLYLLLVPNVTTDIWVCLNLVNMIYRIRYSILSFE